MPVPVVCAPSSHLESGLTHVAVIGAGNAALNAAIAAREAGADVTVLERAPHALRGGNTRFTAGAMRTVYSGVDDLRRLMPDLSADEIERADFGSYSRERFYDDLGRVTQYRTDPELAERLIDSSFETLCWMRDKGVRFLPLYGRQSFEVEGKVRFWGGVTVEAWGGGPGPRGFAGRHRRRGRRRHAFRRTCNGPRKDRRRVRRARGQRRRSEHPGAWMRWCSPVGGSRRIRRGEPVT